MNEAAILWPMVAHALLVFVLYGLLGARRREAVKGGDARIGQFRTRGEEPKISAAVSNSVMNQFELPVLFYAVCLALFVTNGASFVTVALAWLFVLLRYVHAYVHVTSNTMRVRSPVFALGFIVLALMWIWFALHLAAVV